MKSTVSKKLDSRLETARTTELELHLVHLYPLEMNIYGDTGNRLVLQRRTEWRGIHVKTTLVGIGQPIPDDVDIIIGGGGQDAGQGKIELDLQNKSSVLHAMRQDGVVMLMICGMYQLFGRGFTTIDGAHLKGIGIFPIDTIGGAERMIGNTIYRTPYGDVVGYENHSGITTLDSTSLSLGTVIKGSGNNGADGTEGCRVDNVFGTYSHGPVLVKNPAFADALIELALTHRYREKVVPMPPLDDTLELAAQAVAFSRPR